MLNLKNIVNIDGNSYLVSTVEVPNLLSMGGNQETMIFKSNELQEETNVFNKINYDLIEWSYIYAEFYNDYDKASIGHICALENIRDLIKEDN